MRYETIARNAHRRGMSCSRSVYTAFSDINRNMTNPPSPRSEGGKCGAVLAAEKVLRETGVQMTGEFEKRFIQQFSTLKCQELLQSSFSCNDFVGAAAAIAQDLL